MVQLLKFHNSVQVMAQTWAVRNSVLQQFWFAQFWFQTSVATKHNNPQDKPVVFSESRSLVLRIVQVFWLHNAGLREHYHSNQILCQPQLFNTPAQTHG